MKFRLFFYFIFTLLIIQTGFAQGPPIGVEAVKGYILGPGDEIAGKVLGETDFDFIAVVNENGMIELPFGHKPLAAKCRSESEIRSDIKTLLDEYLKDPHLSLTIKRNRPPATVYGEVRTPQQVIMMRKATLVELLGISGGVTDDAGGMIQVFRTQPPICTDDGEASNWKPSATDAAGVPSRLFSLSGVKAGREDSNPVIYPGDIIVVLKASPVYITGEVVAPQGIFLKERGASLSEAIAQVGGIRSEAKTKDIKIHRLKANSTDREIIAANFDLINKGQQKDIILQPYDIIVVDKAKESIGVTIMKFAIGAGKTVLTSGASGIGSRVLY